MDELNYYEEVLPPIPERVPAKPSTQLGNVKAKLDKKKKDTTGSNLKPEDTSDDKHNLNDKYRSLPSGLSTSLPAIHKHKPKTDEHVGFGSKLIRRIRRLISSDSEDKTKQQHSDKEHNIEVKRPQNEYQVNLSSKNASKPVRSRSHSDLESWVLPNTGSEGNKNKNSSDEDCVFQLDGIPDMTCLDNRAPVSIPEKKDEDYINVQEEDLVPPIEYSEPYEVSDLKLKTKDKLKGKGRLAESGKITVASKGSTQKPATDHDLISNERDKSTNLDDYINVQEKFQPPNINVSNAKGGKITATSKGSTEKSATEHAILSNESDKNTTLDDYINVQEEFQTPNINALKAQGGQIIMNPKGSTGQSAIKHVVLSNESDKNTNLDDYINVQEEIQTPNINTLKAQCGQIIMNPKGSTGHSATKHVVLSNESDKNTNLDDYINVQEEIKPPNIKASKPSGEKKAKKSETDKNREKFLELRSKFCETKDSSSETKSKMSQKNHGETEGPSSEPKPDVPEDKELPPICGMTEHECNDSKGDKSVFSVKNLSIEEVCEKLEKLNLGKYVDVYKKNKIDGVILSVLTEEDFVSELGMKKLEAVRLCAFIKSGHVPK